MYKREQKDNGIASDRPIFTVELSEIWPHIETHKKIRGSLQTCRIRKGDYRIIYSIEDDRLVIQVITVGHRKNIYQKFNP